MIKYLFNNMLNSMKERYNYDVSYQQDILRNDLGAFLKFMGFQTMASHSSSVPTAPLYAARIRAILSEDCGPCAQLAVNMALEAKVAPEIVSAIIDNNLVKLPEDVALVVQFTEYVLAHNPEADDLRHEIIALWGEKGLITLGFAISSYRVYPAFKYAMGYGKACSKLQVEDSPFAVTQASASVQG
ncbi:hypothetical protein tinsulaeT_24290 [Thalassotalea insulae]|uniref:Carboxymuconolactone decarboxylase family protein n=1 Tax=Thalassotalea insulae TaxID=2056778 RepID=A0ABQ6GV70_9GAMM|nr:hypothetical protein [Thalassotalea insulae]GLX79089.1 hypothetical protein tinsulaeT_24290 [Thalassotalea insulae]